MGSEHTTWAACLYRQSGVEVRGFGKSEVRGWIGGVDGIEVVGFLLTS